MRDFAVMNLFLALFWLVFAAVLLGMEWLLPAGPRYRIWGTNLSIGWVGLVLGVYNLVRWWSNRLYRAEQRALQQTVRRSRRRGGREASEPLPARNEQAPIRNPDFDFRKPPEPPPPP
jgi:hypothetical protein